MVNVSGTISNYTGSFNLADENMPKYHSVFNNSHMKEPFAAHVALALRRTLDLDDDYQPYVSLSLDDAFMDREPFYYSHAASRSYDNIKCPRDLISEAGQLCYLRRPCTNQADDSDIVMTDDDETSTPHCMTRAIEFVPLKVEGINAICYFPAPPQADRRARQALGMLLTGGALHDARESLVRQSLADGLTSKSWADIGKGAAYCRMAIWGHGGSTTSLASSATEPSNLRTVDGTCHFDRE